MNSAKLKETIANIVKEESEYQVFFRKALEKAGKSITDMSDEEKKEFFNKIDAAWDGKGEKNEGNAFGAAVVAAKKAGEDEFEVGGKTYKVEESVNEASMDWETHFKGFNERELKVIQKFISMNPKGIDGVIQISKNKDFKPFIQKAAKSGLGESVNEEEIKWNAVENAIINFLKANTKILDKRVQAKDTEGVKGGLKSIISGLVNAQRNLKLESVNEGVRISLFDPNKNKILKSLSVDRNYKEAEKEVETLNKRLSASENNKGYYWKITTIGESVNEAVYTQKIKFVMQNSTSSFKNLGNDFKKAGLKYNFSTTPFPHYIVEPGGNKKVAIVSRKNEYDLKGSGIQYSTYIATIKESVNEAGYTVKAKNPYQFLNGVVAVLGAYLRDEELGPKGKRELQNILKSLEYMRMYFYANMSESVNESQFKVGDNVIVTRKDGKEYTGKVEKLNPLKLRTSPSDTMVIPNAYIKDIVVKESVNEEKVYIDFLNKKKGFKQDRIKFTSYEAAVKWAKRNFDNFNPDMIKYESVNEAAGKEAMGIAAFTGTRGDAVQKFIDDNKLDAKKLFNYVKGGKLTDRLNFVTAVVGTPGNPVQKRMIKMFGESVNEVKYPTNLKIGSVILGQGFTMLKGIDGGRYYKIVDMDDFSATLVPSDKNGNVKGSKKVRHKLDSIEGGIKTAKRGDENGIVVIKESVNEEIAVGKMVKVVDNPHWEAALGKKGPFKRKVKMIDGDNVFFTDGSNSSMKYVKESVSSVNEEIGAPVSKTKTVNAKLASGADMGTRPAPALGTIGTVNLGGKKYQVKALRGSTGPIYTLIGHSAFSKNMGMPFWKYFMNKLQELNGGKTVVFTPARDVKVESVESVNEGRAFINAARKAKSEGKTEFEFNGKKYPITLKEGTLNEMNPQFNKKVKMLLDKELKDLRKGGGNHLFAVMHILMGALTDANFHSESKKVPALFGSKAKYEGDPMAEKDLIQMYQYDLGTDIANICKWDGKDIVDAIGFYVSMTVGRPMGEKIENLIV